MGTEITLEVGGLTLDWSKNFVGSYHGMLFQEKDRQRIRSDRINYDYFREQNEDSGPMEMGFCKTLRDVVPRLELLGFTIGRIRREYAGRAESWREQCSGISDDESIQDLMSFDEFRAFATAHPLQDLDDTYIEESGSRDERKARGRFSDPDARKRIPWSDDNENMPYSERSYFEILINVLHPYSVLRLLAQQKANLDAKVMWQYGPLVENGWAKTSEFVSGAQRGQTFLVATEGSSDAHILKHALKLLRPEIEDFFRFIDVSERHPFPGAGNLLKFAEGLAKIDVQNQVIFLFDNDAEGFDTYRRLLELKLPLPPNMRSMLLPELEQFRSFPAQGPEGVSNANINRRAAGIECYLDLTPGKYPPAKVIWTNYKKELNTYQGSLEFKESYVEKFMQQTPSTVSAGNYDASKLRAVLDALVSECSSMAAGDGDLAP